MSEEGGDESLPAGIDAPAAAPHDVKRCEMTGNPCGTDTWVKGWSCPCHTCQAWIAQIAALTSPDIVERIAPQSPTFTMARPEEVIDFVERVRPRVITDSVTIVAVTPADVVTTRARCEWENCASPSIGQWRWRREKYNGRDDTFDTAVYCDGHGGMAELHGAVLKERFK